jgi:signal transduction histidine kinase
LEGGNLQLAELEATRRSLSEEYGCNIAVRILPESAAVTLSELGQITRILSEAVASLVGKYSAGAIDVSVEVGDLLRVVLRSDGPRGELEDREAMPAHSRAITQAMAALGGRCALDFDAQGATLAIDVDREL